MYFCDIYFSFFFFLHFDAHVFSVSFSSYSFCRFEFHKQAYKLKIENSLGIILSHMARILLKSSTILELGKVLKTLIAFAQIGQGSEHFLILCVY